MPNMRVLNINKFFFLNGGVERYYFALTQLLEKHGHDVIHFSMQDDRNFPSKFSEYFVSNLNTKHPGLKLIGQAIRPIWFREAQKQIERLIIDYKPDIAHIHMLYHHLSPSILPVLRKYEIPVVATLHDYKLICPNYLLYTENETCKRCKGHRYYNAVLHRCLKDSVAVSAYAAVEMSIHKLTQVYEKHVDLMIAPSKSVRDLMVEFGQDPAKIVVLPHFIDPSFIAKQDDEMQPEKEPFMLYFGRLSREKGVDKLLKMMYVYKPGLRLKIAGAGPLESELRAYIDQKGLAGKVEFLGHLGGDDLRRQIQLASLCIVPSQTFETFGFAVLESLALGTPVAASRIGAFPEILREDLGELFDPLDLTSMADAVHKLKDRKSPAFSASAKSYAAKQYSSDRHYEQLIDLYQHLIG